MLKNIVFDMGNVLIKWTPELILDVFGVKNEEDRQILLDGMFRAVEWPMQDWGLYNEPDLEKIVKARIPERLHKVAMDCLYHWSDHMVPVPGMKEYLGELKEKGYHLYLLSNASRDLNRYVVKIPGFEYLDGYMVSGSEMVVKPQPEIFVRLMYKYGLTAQESLFVDDLPANCAGARFVGMDSFLFKGDVDALKAYIVERE